MEAVLFQIVRALATVFEITLAFALLNAMFEPKYASKWPLRLSYILLLAAVFSSSARLTVISVKTAVEILLVFLVSLLVFRGRLSIKVFYNLIFSTVLFLSDLLSAFALSFLPQELFLFPTGDILHRLLEIVLPKMILFLFVMLLMVFISRQKKNISLRYWVMLTSVPLTTIVTLTVFQYYSAKLPGEAYMQEYILLQSSALSLSTSWFSPYLQGCKVSLKCEANMSFWSSRWRCKRNPSAGWRRLTPTCASCATI